MRIRSKVSVVALTALLAVPASPQFRAASGAGTKALSAFCALPAAAPERLIAASRAMGGLASIADSAAVRFPEVSPGAWLRDGVGAVVASRVQAAAAQAHDSKQAKAAARTAALDAVSELRDAVLGALADYEKSLPQADRWASEDPIGWVMATSRLATAQRRFEAVLSADERLRFSSVLKRGRAVASRMRAERTLEAARRTARGLKGPWGNGLTEAVLSGDLGALSARAEHAGPSVFLGALASAKAVSGRSLTPEQARRAVDGAQSWAVLRPARSQLKALAMAAELGRREPSAAEPAARILRIAIKYDDEFDAGSAYTYARRLLRSVTAVRRGHRAEEDLIIRRFLAHAAGLLAASLGFLLGSPLLVWAGILSAFISTAGIFFGFDHPFGRARQGLSSLAAAAAVRLKDIGYGHFLFGTALTFLASVLVATLACHVQGALLAWIGVSGLFGMVLWAARPGRG
ncbi:MAG: hypothetical protein HY928_14760 [Elusimicrobia bacterium]|nr:hypothetical protein [Elusimicrobiota bacterium]